MDEKNIRQEALQMSRDLASLVDEQQGLSRAPGKGGTDTAVRDYVRALLRQYRSEEDDRHGRIRALEAAGRRIISGGQTGQESWEITDWRTEELLASGTGASATTTPPRWAWTRTADGCTSTTSRPI